MAFAEAPLLSVSPQGSTRGEPDCTVVWVRGEQDIVTKVALAITIAAAARLDDAPVLVDLSGVTFMDASTVGAIVASRDRLRFRRQLLEVRAPSPPARRILELCALTHLVHGDMEHATGPAAALSTWIDVLPAQPTTRGVPVGPPATSPTPSMSKEPSVSRRRPPSGADRSGR